MGHPRQFGQDLTVLRCSPYFFYIKVPGKKHPIFSDFFYFSFLKYHFFQKKNIWPVSKIWKNSHKSYKIYQNSSAILENGSFKTASVKNKTKYF